MRRIKRLELKKPAQTYLDSKQEAANQARQAEGFDAGKRWDAARQTKKMDMVFNTLKQMAGERERCMYCCDSGIDHIEHFWPKTKFPEKMFQWFNMLGCCTICGRDCKGSRFPMDGDNCLLIDPTTEDPWDFLDFEPENGQITARFDMNANDYSAKGVATVEILHFDRRGSLEAGYLTTYKRLCDRMSALTRQETGAAESKEFIRDLLAEDDHGLLGWFFKGNGKGQSPAVDFARKHPAIWDDCLKAFESC